jgi:hypothetical protein
MVLLKRSPTEDKVLEYEYRIQELNQHCLDKSQKIELLCEQMNCSLEQWMNESQTKE